MRGKAPYAIAAFTIPGITPTYAGKSHHRVAVAVFLEDHPHVCGEKTKKDPITTTFSKTILPKNI